MAVHDAVDRGKALVDLAVDMSLQVSGLCILLHWLCVIHVVFYEIIRRAEESGRYVAWHPEGRGVVRTAHGNMAIGIEDAMIVKDV